MVRALVTGHTGFLGRNLVPALVGQDMETIGYSSREGKDILDDRAILEATRNVSVVYHLAAYARPAESLQNPSQAIEVNVRGTLNVLEACRRNDFKLVYPSTCEIYGDSSEPITEEHQLNPPNPYAASKVAADRLCFSYSKAYGLRVAILRLFNPYGPQQQLNKIIPTFYFQAVKERPITVYGSGGDTRDYTHVSDIVKALLMATKLPSGRAVNICTGRTLTNMAVAKLIKNITGSSSAITLVNYPPLFGGIRHQVGSYSKANSVLGWKPAVSFEEGLKNTIEWLKTLPVAAVTLEETQIPTS